MVVSKVNDISKYHTLNSFASLQPRKGRSYISYRYHKVRETERQDAAKALAGAIVGTVIPLVLFAKKQKTGIFKLNYSLKELIGVSTGSIIGGVLGGFIDSDRHDRLQKVKEGVFQFFNASIPPALVIGIRKLGGQKLNSISGQIGTTVAGLTAGMYAAAKLSNFVCDPKDKVPDRKLTFKDSLANLDDALGILAMSNFPALKKVTGAILPAIYAFCGYRAGESN